MFFDISAALSFDSVTPCQLGAIMGRYGSDKGNATNTNWHNYANLYEPLFKPVINEHIRIFELGLGTNNTDVASNMGADGKPGASLRGWREFFPYAKVFGADIDRRILFEEERISTFYCDQTSPSDIHTMWDNEVLKEPFDIIIDDGLHAFGANVCFFENSIHKLKPGGVFIIEDVINRYIPAYVSKINEWKSIYPGITFHIVQLQHNRNSIDNTLIICIKGVV